MAIQWFPGHMHKAGREIKQALDHVNAVIEVLDARIPYSSQNPFLAKLRGDKPCVKILNKSDLADPALTALWQAYFEREQSVKTIAVSMHQPERIKRLDDAVRQNLPSTRTPDKQILALIMGIPNVGKSTAINILAGRSVAKTGDEPAVTKMQQRIALGQDFVLLDTPGMLWPNVENRHSGYRLAATGAIKDTAISHEDVARYLLETLLKLYPENLTNRYSLEIADQTVDSFLTEVGAKRGCLRTGGVVDLDKAAKIVLKEYRSGLLGSMTLETPDMIADELIEVDETRRLKMEKKLARQSKHKGNA